MKLIGSARPRWCLGEDPGSLAYASAGVTLFPPIPYHPPRHPGRGLPASSRISGSDLSGCAFVMREPGSHPSRVIDPGSLAPASAGVTLFRPSATTHLVIPGEHPW